MIIILPTGSAAYKDMWFLFARVTLAAPEWHSRAAMLHQESPERTR